MNNAHGVFHLSQRNAPMAMSLKSFLFWCCSGLCSLVPCGVQVSIQHLRPKAVLPQIFEQSVPHMKIPTSLSSSMKLWAGGRMFLKRLDTDEGVFFGKFDRGTQTTASIRSFPWNQMR